MRKIYYLTTCDTCSKFMKQILGIDSFERKDIKTDAITEAELDLMHELSGSYEALFSRRARKFRSMSLHERLLKESDYRGLILDEYTFLKRPVVIIDGHIFIGSVAENIEAINSLLK